MLYTHGATQPPCKTITVTKRLREPAEGQEPGGTDPPDGSGTSQHCWEIDWPAPHVEITGRTYERSLVGAVGWSGSQIDAMRDASGLMYRRNRYYDPSSGRFTQEDPIGLAGRLNVYGFAAGDPVTYGDPYGLKIDMTGLPAWQQAAIHQLRRLSPTFARWYDELDGSAALVTIRSPLGDIEGTRVRNHNGASTEVVHVPFFGRGGTVLLKANGYRGGAEFQSVIAHEFAHLMAGLQDVPSNCWGRTPRQRADAEDCAVKQQNRVHQELGWRDRRDAADMGPYNPSNQSRSEEETNEE